MPLRNTVASASKWVKIGTLLLKSGVIQPEQFAQSLERSKQCDTLVGSVLVRSGWVKHEELTAALYLQAMIAEGTLYADLAIKAMKLVHEQGCTAYAALSALGYKAVVQPKADEIEHLLTEAGFVSRDLYSSVVCAEKTAFALVLKGALRCNQFNEILKTVSLVRANICTLEQATVALKTYRETGIGIEETLTRNFGLSMRKTSLRLGELLVSACILSEADMLLALEKSLRTRSRLGVWLTTGTTLSASALDICLEIQSLASSGVLDADRAGKIAKRCIDLHSTVGDYLKSSKALLENPRASAALIDILKKAQLITDEDVRDAQNMTRKFCLGPTAALAVTNRIDRNTYKALWHYHDQIAKGLLRPDQAVVALMWCQRTGGDPAESILHISGKANAIDTDVQPGRSTREQLSEGTKAFRVVEDEQKNTLDRNFRTAGVALAVVLFTAMCFFLNDTSIKLSTIAIAFCLSAYLSYKGGKRLIQLKAEKISRRLAEITALRRKPTPSGEHASIA
ncbi:MAG TPA: hypothetical protein V6D22_00105 [Candidatus Obscuribacterales bacterium]